MTRAMIVAAHPDDAELAVGGTIAKMIAAGWDVVVVDLTDGEPTPLGSKQLRKAETEKASRILGIENRVCLQMANRQLQPTLENRTKLAETIRLNQPDLIFVPAMPDYHPDHVATSQMANAARFEAKYHKTSMKGSPHWVPRQLEYYSTHRPEHNRADLMVDVSDFWDQKISAIRAYDSQLRHVSPSNTASLLEKVEVTCRYFGHCIGVKFAEPFLAREPIAVNNLELLVPRRPI